MATEDVFKMIVLTHTCTQNINLTLCRANRLFGVNEKYLRTISDWRAWRSVGFANKLVTQSTVFSLSSYPDIVMQNVFWPAAKLQLTAIVHRFANNNQDQLTN
jgi:hypothetical protein